MDKLGIIIVIESGDLEQKTRLLVESIRTYGGEIKDAKIWTVKPRKGKPIKKETLRFLKDRDVEFIDINLNTKWYLYGFANKIYASAYIEEKFGALYDTLLFLDCDTVVLNSIEIDLLKGKYQLAIKPAEEKFIEISKEDKITPFWKIIYDNCDVNPDKVWSVTTTVDEKVVLASFNSGVIFSNPETGFFKRWLKNFEKLARDTRVYHMIYTEFYLLEQALLAGTIIKSFSFHQVRLLNNYYNFPFHFYSCLSEKEEITNIRILHYHHLFQDDPVPYLENLPVSKSLFLKEYLPLKSDKESTIEKTFSTIRYVFWRVKNKLVLKYLKSI